LSKGYVDKKKQYEQVQVDCVKVNGFLIGVAQRQENLENKD